MQYAAIDWILFNSVVAILLFVDLYLFGRQTHKMSFRESLFTCSLWIGLALLFGIYIYWRGGLNDALDYLAGYLIEYNLSIDNLFIFLLVFSYFHVPKQYTHKVLFWGILGAIVMRAIFIALGIVIVEKFSWMLYIFGLFLLYTGYKLLREKEPKIDPEHNPLVVLARRWIPMTDSFHGNSFFVKIDNVWKATPLFLVLLLIEGSDLIFAVDSIPAVFSITQDEVVLYTSNVFAIMGLRAMFFLLAGIIDKFYLLKKGLSLVLMFIGVKMCLELFNWIGDQIHLPMISDINFYVSTKISLLIILLLLGGSVVLSLVFPKKESHPA